MLMRFLKRYLLGRRDESRLYRKHLLERRDESRFLKDIYWEDAMNRVSTKDTYWGNTANYNFTKVYKNKIYAGKISKKIKTGGNFALIFSKEGLKLKRI